VKPHDWESWKMSVRASNALSSVDKPAKFVLFQDVHGRPGVGENTVREIASILAEHGFTAVANGVRERDAYLEAKRGKLDNSWRARALRAEKLIAEAFESGFFEASNFHDRVAALLNEAAKYK